MREITLMIDLVDKLNRAEDKPFNYTIDDRKLGLFVRTCRDLGLKHRLVQDDNKRLVFELSREEAKC